MISMISLPLHLALFIASFCDAASASQAHGPHAGTHNQLAKRASITPHSLFPLGLGSSSWSTSPSSQASSRIKLDDSAFRPFKVLQSTRHSYSSAPDGKRAMRAYYPKGSYTFGNNPKGGFSFYGKGNVGRLDLRKAREVTFGYSVYFPRGFGFQKGGKLPGIYGGNTDSSAEGCSGGRRSNACFSSRLMWRSQADGELYTYLPTHSANKKQCSVHPQSDCNPTYGASVGRGAFKFETGGWTVVTQRIRLNDVGKANGALQLWVNGRMVIDLRGVVLRTKPEARIRGMMFQTFFGGSNPSFASPKNQEVFMSDFSLAITERL